MKPPGDYLLADMREAGDTLTKLADKLGISVPYVSDIVQGRKGISVVVAKALEQAGYRTAREWLSMQKEYNLNRTFEREGIR